MLQTTTFIHASRSLAVVLFTCAVAVTGWASPGDELFGLDPQASQALVVSGRSGGIVGAAQRISVEGRFGSDARVEAWAGEQIVFVEGFAATGGGMRFHVGAAPGKSMKRAASETAQAPLFAEVRVSKETLMLAYGLPSDAKVSVRILDLSGKTVSSKTLGARPAGRHEERLTSNHLKAGAYFIRVSAGKDVVTRRIMILER